MDVNLIPFGLDIKDGRLVDVSEVPRGRGCGCVCPSCGTPLIARKGDLKQWHFAHATRSVYSTTERECEYSLYVSIRLMARQLIGDRISIMLPEYRDRVAERLPDCARCIDVPFTVTKQQELTLSDVEVEASFHGVPVDVYGKVDEFEFIVYFTHPGRSVPLQLYNLGKPECGIVSVSLLQVPKLFGNIQHQKDRYLDRLLAFLSTDIDSKRWVYHPRYARRQKEAESELQDKVAKFAQRQPLGKRPYGGRRRHGEHTAAVNVSNITIPVEPIPEPPRRLAIFECVLCHTTWQDWVPSGSVCPKCNTHLYRTVKDYL